jgi:membrane-bound serine protease (ClpP class)
MSFLTVSRWVGAFALAFSVLVGVSSASAAVAIHIHVDGVINPIKARYVHQALETAKNRNAAFVLMSINTPGGLVSSMEDIVADMSNSPVPVIGFVEPPTAQATSAGAFLLLATDVAAMAPGTRVGAAHPVGSDKNLEGAMEEKATNSLVSLAKSLATRHNRPESYAESIVRKSASFTAEEAKTAGAVEIIAPTVVALLETLDGYAIVTADRNVQLSTKHLELAPLPLSPSNRLLDVISNPTLASILLSLGVLGILYELSSPGIGLAGIVGTICLVLALVALSTLPLKLGGFVLLLAGFVSIAVEVKSPAHGALALGGVVALILGALVLVDETGYFGGAQKLDFRIFAPFIVVVSGSFLLFAGIAAKALRAPAQSGLEMMRGTAGVARTQIGPDGGMVFVEGSRWQATSDAVIEPGEEIVVEEVTSNPTRLRVKATEKGAS